MKNKTFKQIYYKKAPHMLVQFLLIICEYKTEFQYFFPENFEVF